MSAAAPQLPDASHREPRRVPCWPNALRLSPIQCAAVLLLIGLIFAVTPRAWEKIEPFPTGPDYRLPYALSDDYWLYERRLRQIKDPDQIIVIGDSVVWGEYVKPDGTLTHFLNEQMGSSKFVNAGLNGLFPLAMEGLISHYGAPLRKRKLIVHCNILWMTSPKADLSSDKEEPFNHPRLVPQFSPPIPSYRADANERLSAVVEHHVPMFQWARHLDSAYYGQKSLPQWTLAEDGSEPPNYPNAWINPLAPLFHGIPQEPANDPLRGPSSRRHRAWTADGADPTDFEWVPLKSSLQWQAFRATILDLRRRGNDVLVVFGPFNEHMVTADQRSTFASYRSAILLWLNQNHVPAVAPATLDSDLYADASHPLTQGYRRLAEELLADTSFRSWLTR